MGDGTPYCGSMYMCSDVGSQSSQVGEGSDRTIDKCLILAPSTAV